ncbi:MAG: response regulator [Bacteroidales bacterium]|nr:response regulator [Bacteroidales bacterium]
MLKYRHTLLSEEYFQNIFMLFSVFSLIISVLFYFQDLYLASSVFLVFCATSIVFLFQKIAQFPFVYLGVLTITYFYTIIEFDSLHYMYGSFFVLIYAGLFRSHKLFVTSAFLLFVASFIIRASNFDVFTQSYFIFGVVYIFFVMYVSVIRSFIYAINNERSKAFQHISEQTNSVDIVSDLSYKVRTHLSSILGFLTILKTEKIDLGQHNSYFVEKLQQENRSLLTTLDSYGAETSRTKSEAQNNCVAIVSETINKLVADEHSVSFSVKTKGNVPSDVQSDFNELRLVFLEIVESILKSRRGIRSIDIDVIISFPLESQTLQTFLFEVNVSGMKKLIYPAPQSVDVFSDSYENSNILLYQTDRDDYAQIFLPQTLQVLDEQKAKIAITQANKRDVSFVFSYSFWKKKPLKKSDSLPKEKKDMTSRIENLRVLLVEDNLMNQNMVAMILKKRVHEVMVANNGKEALQILSSSKVDVILMDIQMPILDGYQTTDRIREIELTNEVHTPIIALTANALDNERQLCLEKGMDGYLSKPFGIKELMGVIEEVIQQNDTVE